MVEMLLDCPFCGGKAKEFTGEDAAPHRWTVECDACGAHVGSGTRHRARTKWNRRAERTCRVVRMGNPSPTGVPRERRCSECGGRLTRFGAYCRNCGARVVSG